MRVLTTCLASVLFMCSCISEHGVAMADTDPLGWGEPVTVPLMNDDTLSMHDISVVVRFDRSLVADSVLLSIETITPDSLHISESVTLHFPGPDHRDDMSEARAPYRTRVALAKAGEYKFRISPVSPSPVRGITAAGFDFTDAGR